MNGEHDPFTRELHLQCTTFFFFFLNFLLDRDSLSLASLELAI